MKTRPEIIDGPDGYDELDIDVWLHQWLFDSSYFFFFHFQMMPLSGKGCLLEKSAGRRDFRCSISSDRFNRGLDWYHTAMSQRI